MKLRRLIRSVLPASVADRLHGLHMIWDYRRRILKKHLMRNKLPQIEHEFENYPSVTVCITNSNNCGPLELTLRSLLQTTSWPNLNIVVADNCSTDNSLHVLEEIRAHHPIQVIKGRRQRQYLWYDEFARTVATDYWVGIHEDMYFIATGWLEDLIGYMETHPDVDMLAGEYFPAQNNAVEPVGGAIVDLRESLSTWIFCCRRDLAQKVDTSFEFYKYEDPVNKKTITYDLGGKLIEDMRTAKCNFECMPPWFLNKWHHLANVTWAFKQQMDCGTRWFKTYQIRDAERRAKRLRKAQSVKSNKE